VSPVPRWVGSTALNLAFTPILHTVASIQLHIVTIVTCSTYPDKFTQDNVISPFFYYFLCHSTPQSLLAELVRQTTYWRLRPTWRATDADTDDSLFPRHVLDELLPFDNKGQSNLSNTTYLYPLRLTRWDDQCFLLERLHWPTDSDLYERYVIYIIQWIICYHRNVFLLIYEHALAILSSYPSTLHCCINKFFIVRVLHKHVVLFGHWLDFVWLWFFINVAFYVRLSHE